MPYGQLISEKIVKIVATRGHILRHQILFRLKLQPRPDGEFKQPPDRRLAGLDLRGPTYNVRVDREKGKRNGKETS